MSSLCKEPQFTDATTLTLLIALAFWQAFEFLFLGPASVVIFADNGEQLLPSLLVRGFSGSLLSSWDRFGAGGVDQISGADHALLNIFFFNLIPGWLATGLYTLAQYAGAGFGVYALGRWTLRLPPVASLFAGAAFMVQLHPYIASAVFSFLPLAIFALSAFIKQPSRLRSAGLLASILLLCGTGYFSRLIPYASVMIFVWFLIVERPRRAQSWLTIVLVCTAIPLLRIKDVIVLGMVAPMSHTNWVRVTQDLHQAWEKMGVPWFLLSPLGLACTGLATLAFVLERKYRTHIIALFILALAGSIFIELSLTALQDQIVPFWPTLSGFRFTYFSALTSMALALFGGIGIATLAHYLGRTKKPGVVILCMGAAAVIASGCIAYVSLKGKYASLLSWTTQGSYARNFESTPLHNLKRSIDAGEMPVRVEPYQIAPAVLNGYGIETAGGYTPIYYKPYYEYWAAVVRTWAKNEVLETRFGGKFKSRRIDRGGSMIFRGDRLALYPLEYAPAVNLSTMYDLKLLSLANVGYFVSRDVLTDEQLDLVSGPGTAWSALSDEKRTQYNIRANFRGLSDLYIYKNAHVQPRFFSVAGVDVFEDDAAVLQHLEQTPLDKLVRRAPIPRAALGGLIPDDVYMPLEAINVAAYDNDTIFLQLGDPRTGKSLLVVSNTYSPYWQVEIDGRPAKLMRAYHAFWAVEIPADAKSVKFRYRPPYNIFS